MKCNQTLFHISAEILEKLEGVLEHCKPDIVLVQGDATTAFIGALAALYKKIKVAHVEAGLRSCNKYSPFPEEVNRILISHLADYHFAPTEAAKENFFKEGIKNNVQIIYPVHLNPSVKKTTSEIIKNMQNVHLIPPVDYFHLVWLMDKAYLVITDSGGIQEEAPSLGKPVLVIRNVTERVEGIKARTVKLI